MKTNRERVKGVLMTVIALALIAGMIWKDIQATTALAMEPVDEVESTSYVPETPVETTPVVTEPEQPEIVSYEDFMAGIYDDYSYESYEKLFTMYDYEQFMTRSPIPQYFQSLYPDTRFADGTIRSSGCGITCLAMISSYLYGETITPDMLTMDYKGDNPAVVLERWVTDDYLGVRMDMYYGNDARTQFDIAMENGNPVILLHRAPNSIFTDGGHFIVVAGMTEDGRYIVNDPNMWNLRCFDADCHHAKKGEPCPYVDEYMYGFTREQLMQGLVGTYVFDTKDEFDGDPARLPHR